MRWGDYLHSSKGVALVTAEGKACGVGAMAVGGRGGGMGCAQNESERPLENGGEMTLCGRFGGGGSHCTERQY